MFEKSDRGSARRVGGLGEWGAAGEGVLQGSRAPRSVRIQELGWPQPEGMTRMRSTSVPGSVPGRSDPTHPAAAVISDTVVPPRATDPPVCPASAPPPPAAVPVVWALALP